MTPFDALTITEARRALEGAVSDAARAARAYADGDHWQEGRGWAGPRPALGEPGALETLREIERAFISKNAVGEALNRHRAGVVGQPVAWRLTVARPLTPDEMPPADEQARIAEAEAALTTWWDSADVAQLLQDALITLLCAGRSPLRLFVPPGLLVARADGAMALPPGDLAAQLGRIALDRPDPAVAKVVTDPATRQRAGLFVYEEAKRPRAELSAADGETTVLRILDADGVASEARLPLGGRLLLHELTRPPLITASVLSLQRLLNLALTMLGRNVVLGGFLERVLLNAQLPGEFVADPATGVKVFVPHPLRFGAGSITALTGAEIRDEATGELKGYATPSVVYRDPVPVQTFADTRDIAYHAILEGCQQAHAILSGEATPSGESRRQALADFLSSLRLTAPAVEGATRWLLETALHLAAHFAGQPGRYLDLRAVATCHLDTGPLSTDEAAQVVSLVDARLLSRETGMARVGIDDSDAEAQRIQAEQEADATVGQAAISSFNSGA